MTFTVRLLNVSMRTNPYPGFPDFVSNEFVVYTLPDFPMRVLSDPVVYNTVLPIGTQD